MTTQPDQFPREQYQTQAPIGACSAGLAASIALGRLLRMAPHADIASIRFEIRDQGEGAYAGPGPYVIASAAEPDECPSCHTIAGQHPHTEYCRRTAELAHRADLWPGETTLDDLIAGDLTQTAFVFGIPVVVDPPMPPDTMRFGQTSQPATHTSQPPTQARVIKAADHPNDWTATLVASAPRTCRICGCTDDNACDLGCYWVGEDLCSSCHGGGFTNTTPLSEPTPGQCASCGQDYDQAPVDCATPERHDQPR